MLQVSYQTETRFCCADSLSVAKSNRTSKVIGVNKIFTD